MPKPVNMAVRLQVISQYKASVPKSRIAKNFGIGRTTIHNLIKSYLSKGEEGLKPNYSNCGKIRPTGQDLLYRSFRCMKIWHPEWGAERIRVKISILRPSWELPSLRTINYWFRWENPVRPKSEKPEPIKHLATKIHEIWQVDAKEEMKTVDGQAHCWLNITDEYTGAVIDPPLFSLRKNQHRSFIGSTICPIIHL